MDPNINNMYIISKFIGFVSYITNNPSALCQRIVECCNYGSGKRAKRSLINISTANILQLTSRKNSTLTSIPHEVKIRIDGTNPDEIIKDYLSHYEQDSFSPLMQIVLAFGRINPDGKITNLHSEIYIRLKKIGLIWQNSFPQCHQKICIPALENGELDFIDQLGWFCKNPTIQRKFERIAEASRSVTHSSYFNILFGIDDNNHTITPTKLLELAKHIKNALDENNVSCGKDQYCALEKHIHENHSTDKGKLLPKHYVVILRTFFIIFGIFPKNWEPETKEDFIAMEKYYRRLLHRFYQEV